VHRKSRQGASTILFFPQKFQVREVDVVNVVASVTSGPVLGFVHEITEPREVILAIAGIEKLGTPFAQILG